MTARIFFLYRIAALWLGLFWLTAPANAQVSTVWITNLVDFGGVYRVTPDVELVIIPGFTWSATNGVVSTTAGILSSAGGVLGYGLGEDHCIALVQGIQAVIDGQKIYAITERSEWNITGPITVGAQSSRCGLFLQSNATLRSREHLTPDEVERT